MNEIREKITEYGEEVSDLAIALSIEAFKDIRRYPIGYSQERIDKDVQANINKIAMAAIEIESKNGAENELSRTENGVSASFYQGILAYKDVLAIAHL